MSTNHDQNHAPRLAVLLPILAGCGWGIVGVFLRPLSDAGFDNPTVVFSRNSMSLLLVFLFIFLTDKSKLHISIKDIPWFLSISVVGSILLMATYNTAVGVLTLSLAAVLLCLAPVFVLLISAVLFREKITRRKVVCMVAAIAGCVLLSGVLEESSLVWNGYGVLMGLASALCNGIYIILAKAASNKGYDTFTMCFYTMLISSLILIPLTDWHTLGSFIANAPVTGTGFLVLQSLITSMIPSVTYFLSMKYLEAGKSAILESGAEPTAAFLAGLLIYHEIPTLPGFCGMVITILALMVLASS